MLLKNEKIMDALREHWNQLYRKRLPVLAKDKDPAQPKWPVVLDHCFARIVLDNAVGVDKPWAEVVKAPATKNMSEAQLQAAISLGEALASGEANLVELDERSLRLRGKKSKAGGRETGAGFVGEVGGAGQKRKVDEGKISKYFAPSPVSPRKRTKVKSVERDTEAATHPAEKKAASTELSRTDSTAEAPTFNADADMSAELARIVNSNLTSFRKKTLSMLCQIPRGRYSTYSAMSDHITATSHKTCARAVGNAMRNNPFAPEVPCHRILAADGSLGGFGGHWGENGKFASKKHELLHEEGVRFDGRGKVIGKPFREFQAN